MIRIRCQRALNWLIDPGPSVSSEVRVRLADHLLSSPGAVIMGAFNGLLTGLSAIFLHYRYWFVVLVIAEVVCGVRRLVVIRAIVTARKAAPMPRSTPRH